MYTIAGKYGTYENSQSNGNEGGAKIKNYGNIIKYFKILILIKKT